MLLASLMPPMITGIRRLVVQVLCMHGRKSRWRELWRKSFEK